MLKGLFILGADNYERIYGPAEREDIHQLVEIYAPPQTAADVAANPAILQDADLIFSGWGGPCMDADFLAAAPRLKAVFYGAGSVRGIVTDAFWESGIVITSAAAANAIPVAEFTLSQIIFCLKHGWYHALEMKRKGQKVKRRAVPGAYGSTVGLISLGMIGRRVAELLKLLDVKVIAYDPFVPAQTAAELGVEMVGLDDVFERADVVSLHTPWLKETEGMITGAHFARMKPNAAFINTARGAVVREDEMIAVLSQRPDICAVLDVTHPEPPIPRSPLYTLPNVVLTPHIAGSVGPECWRMGRYMVDELRRYLDGEPLRYAITKAQFERMA
ncbi:MAG TPA: hydroxyacid dehydrogenase [Spirillospora sp.]|nr:hydroxyacid dehydrogenase [Spirillospora sp.]